MPTQVQALKAKIMAQVEGLVEQALTEGEEALTLTQIEEVALRVRGQVEQEITQALMEQQVSSRAGVIPTCPECGRGMHPKGKKRRYLRTRSGEVAIQRPYFYCEHCRGGHFPPG